MVVRKKNNCGAHSFERGQACLTPTEEDLGGPKGSVGELRTLESWEGMGVEGRDRWVGRGG